MSCFSDSAVPNSSAWSRPTVEVSLASMTLRRVTAMYAASAGHSGALTTASLYTLMAACSSSYQPYLTQSHTQSPLWEWHSFLNLITSSQNWTDFIKQSISNRFDQLLQRKPRLLTSSNWFLPVQAGLDPPKLVRTSPNWFGSAQTGSDLFQVVRTSSKWFDANVVVSYVHGYMKWTVFYVL